MSSDRFASARAVADAVLYEGYVLYPYRASSAKNQVRWQFGVLVPPAFSQADGSERWRSRTECIVAPGPSAELTVRIRFLQVQHRGVEAANGDGGFTPVDSLEVEGNVLVGWDEALDRVIDLAPLPLVPGEESDWDRPFTLDAGETTEAVRSASGHVAARIVRRQEAVKGLVRVEATGVEGAGPLVKVTVTVSNATSWSGTSLRRDDVMGQCLVAVHTMLAVDDGVFVSLLDPPDEAAAAVATCHSDGAFPILIGDDDVVLSSPIILYDHPEVAPESPGDLYDSTEIDEILALRVLTLTDEEKAEARATDPRAAAIIDRCDDMAPEQWERLHGAVRALGPRGEAAAWPGTGDPQPVEPPAVPWWDPEADAAVDPWSDSVWVAGVEVRKGSAVRLAPSHRADAQDLFLAGLTATVAGVFKDVDGTEQVAVTVDDDPATEELQWQGRFLFFHPDEVVPLTRRETAS